MLLNQIVKTKICRNMQQKGICSYGDRCTFIHDIKSQIQPQPPIQQLQNFQDDIMQNISIGGVNLDRKDEEQGHQHKHKKMEKYNSRSRSRSHDRQKSKHSKNDRSRRSQSRSNSAQYRKKHSSNRDKDRHHHNQEHYRQRSKSRSQQDSHRHQYSKKYSKSRSRSKDNNNYDNKNQYQDKMKQSQYQQGYNSNRFNNQRQYQQYPQSNAKPYKRGYKQGMDLDAQKQKFDNDLDDYFNKQNEQMQQQEEEQKDQNALSTPFIAQLPNDYIKGQFKISLQISSSKPEIKGQFGNNKELIEIKNKISPISDVWDKEIKLLISEYELIDIYRPDHKAYQRYHKPVIDYNKLQWIFSRAYFKLWETIAIFDSLANYKNEKILIGNLAEGPGGFLHCLMDYRKQQKNDTEWNQDKYCAITLKIADENDSAKALDWSYFKSQKFFDFQKKKGHKIVLSYGAGDGNMLDTKNLRHYVEKDLNNQKCQLVTADGGIECSTDEQYQFQELYNVKLFFAEVITAFSIQEEHGNFIMKIYDSYFDVTIDILLLLTMHYTKVSIVKPYTSRPASSERYLMCEDFKGIDQDVLSQLYDLLDQWWEMEKDFDYLNNSKFCVKFLDFEVNENSKFQENLRKSNEDCIAYQIKKIQEGLDIYEKYKKENDTNNQQQQLIPQNVVYDQQVKQLETAIKWCKKYKVPYLKDLEIHKN